MACSTMAGTPSRGSVRAVFGQCLGSRSKKQSSLFNKGTRPVPSNVEPLRPSEECPTR